MRLISSVVLVFYVFSPAFSTSLESVSKSEQGEASNTSAPPSVIPEWAHGFLPPLSNSEASTTSTTSNLAPEETERVKGEASLPITTPESGWEKGILPPLSNSEASTSSATSNTTSEESLKHNVLQLERILSTKFKTNSKEEITSEKNASADETSAKPPHHTTSKKPHHIHKKPAKPTQPPVPMTVTPFTDHPTRHQPCRCIDGMCACCTGAILESLHIPVHRRACANVEYEPDDFAFRVKLFWNDKLLFNQRMSGKNPRPACITINRYFGVKMCVRLSDVYFAGRNMHACLDLEGTYDDDVVFHYSFNCFRIGNHGVAALKPEDGGGLPPPPDEEEQVDEDYDDSARGWRSKVHVINV